MTDATTAKLSSMRFHGWQLGLKTGMYYLRTKAAVDAIKFTVDVEKVRRGSTAGQEASQASLPEVATGSGASKEQEAIERLKASEPKSACLNSAAECLKPFSPDRACSHEGIEMRTFFSVGWRSCRDRVRGCERGDSCSRDCCGRK